MTTIFAFDTYLNLAIALQKLVQFFFLKKKVYCKNWWQANCIDSIYINEIRDKDFLLCPNRFILLVPVPIHIEQGIVSTWIFISIVGRIFAKEILCCFLSNSTFSVGMFNFFFLLRISLYSRIIWNTYSSGNYHLIEWHLWPISDFRYMG